MSILGLVWAASWFGCFSSLGEKLLEAPRYLSNVLSRQVSHPLRDSANKSQTVFQNGLTSVHSSHQFNGSASLNLKLSQDSRSPNALPIQSAPAHAVLLGAIESFFKNPSQPVAYASNVGQASGFQLIDWRRPSSATLGPLNHLVEVVQNFFWGVPSVAADFDTDLPAVVVIQSGTEIADSSRLSSSTGFWRCAAWQRNPSEHSAMGGFQIWVKGCLVAEIPDQSAANAIASRLTTILKHPALNAAQLQPTIEQNKPAAKLGNRTVFAIGDDLAAKFDRPAELVAIEWVNNLRIALGEDPLSLAEAQVQMHRLQDTGGSISGLASWYGPYFHGRLTATGEVFDQNELTAAHPSLPFDTYLKVTNLLNGKSVVVRVNDRGPYFDNRVLDLSNRAARCIDSDNKGVVPIEAVVMQPKLSSSEQVALK